jgi:molybdopterin/thiamine biosynthesis adenylyltransferase
MKKVTVVGVGALGSHVVQHLRNEDASVRIVDFDRVEQRNTGSQFHGRPGVGKQKVAALAQVMSHLWGFKVETNSNRVTKDNVGVILGGSDLVIDCLDNGASRRLVQDFVRGAKIPCLHGALSGDGTFGRVIWDESFRIDDEPGAGAATCENGDHLPFIGVVSAFLAKSVQEFLRRGRKTGFQVHAFGAVSV